jgi:hypothetical protein
VKIDIEEWRKDYIDGKEFSAMRVLGLLSYIEEQNKTITRYREVLSHYYDLAMKLKGEEDGQPNTD